VHLAGAHLRAVRELVLARHELVEHVADGLEVRVLAAGAHERVRPDGAQPPQLGEARERAVGA